jgi:hypothetical protein
MCTNLSVFRVCVYWCLGNETVRGINTSKNVVRTYTQHPGNTTSTTSIARRISPLRKGKHTIIKHGKIRNNYKTIIWKTCKIHNTYGTHTTNIRKIYGTNTEQIRNTNGTNTKHTKIQTQIRNKYGKYTEQIRKHYKNP